jgi:hypothetical protein
LRKAHGLDSRALMSSLPLQKTKAAVAAGFGSPSWRDEAASASVQHLGAGRRTSSRKARHKVALYSPSYRLALVKPEWSLGQVDLA